MMFERNRVETGLSTKRHGVPVEVTLDDGRVLKGRFLISETRSIFDVLNGPASFLEFETYEGDGSLIAKTMIRELRLVGVPQPGQLKRGFSSGHNDFDPYQILGVARGSDYETVRLAFHKLSKIYHPDRYQAADLPPEVSAYLSSMSRRINAAYAAIAEPLQLQRKAAAMRAEPIYTSGAR